MPSKLTRNLFSVSVLLPQAPLGQLGALLGFTKIQQVGGTLAVQGTAWTNAASLAGLSCVGGFTAFLSNSNLTALNGLEKLTKVNYKGVQGAAVFVASGNPALTAAGYLPLRTLASCNGAVSPLTAVVNATASIGTGCPRTATRFTGVCQFATGSCVGVV